MSKRGKMLVALFVIVIGSILLKTNQVNAVLRAAGNEGTKANLNDWVYYTRQMQTTGGTLGLTDTISDTDLSSSNKSLDIHFQKNTEYGAMAILSASAYGNPDKITDGGTSTGNVLGVQIKLNGEWTSAATSTTSVWALTVAKNRYWNNYGTGNGSNGKIGDATAETNGWHASAGNTWLSHGCPHHGAPVSDAAFLRSCCESVFGFYGLSYYGARHAGYQWCPDYPDRGADGYGAYNSGEGKGSAHVGAEWYGRAVVVVGSGV